MNDNTYTARLKRTPTARSMHNAEIAETLLGIASDMIDRGYIVQDMVDGLDQYDFHVSQAEDYAALHEAAARLLGDDLPKQFCFTDQQWADALERADHAASEYQRLCIAFEELLAKYNALTAKNVPTTGDIENPTNTTPTNA